MLIIDDNVIFFNFFRCFCLFTACNRVFFANYKIFIIGDECENSNLIIALLVLFVVFSILYTY